MQYVERVVEIANTLFFCGKDRWIKIEMLDYAVKEGVSVTVLSKILGHSSVQITTEIYAHLIDERQVKEKMRKISYT